MGRARRFLTETCGASVAEYALLLGLIGAGLLVALNVLGGSITSSFTRSSLLIANNGAAGASGAAAQPAGSPGKSGAAPGLAGANPGRSGAAPAKAANN